MKKKETKELLEQISTYIESPIYPTPEPRILLASIGGEVNWRFRVFSAVDLVEFR